MMDERALIESAKDETLQRVRDDRESASGDYDVEELLEIIEARLFHPDFDLGELRRELTPNSETLRRFRLLCGGSPKSYVNARRLDAARRLLEEPAIDLPDLAHTLGFADTALFSRWCKRWAGKTPKEWRAALPPAAPPRPAVESEPVDTSIEWLTISVWLRTRSEALHCLEIPRLIHLIRARTIRPRRP